MRISLLAALGLCAPIVLGAHAPGAPQPGFDQPTSEPRHNAVPRLIAEHTSIAPGGSTTLGVTFEIRDKWHLYWDGFNDTGMPPEVILRLPEGLTQGKMLWPAPKRYVLPGDILDHIYEKRVTLLIPITASEDLSEGTALEISAELDWLECADACLPGSGAVALTLARGDAGDDAERSRDARLIDQARARVPKKLPKEAPPVVVKLDQGAVSVRATGNGVAKLAFYPANRCVRIPDLIRQGQASGRALKLEHSPPARNRDRFAGIVEVFYDEPKRSEVYEVSIPVPSE